MSKTAGPGGLRSKNGAGADLWVIGSYSRRLRLGWQKAVDYGRRSHAETAMFRYKAVIGSSLRARMFPAQKTEAKVACSVLNRMTGLGMPICQRIR